MIFSFYVQHSLFTFTKPSFSFNVLLKRSFACLESSSTLTLQSFSLTKQEFCFSCANHFTEWTINLTERSIQYFNCTCDFDNPFHSLNNHHHKSGINLPLDKCICSSSFAENYESHKNIKISKFLSR